MSRLHYPTIELGSYEYVVTYTEELGYQGDYFNPPDPSDFILDSIYCVDMNRDVTNLFSEDLKEVILEIALKDRF